MKKKSKNIKNKIILIVSLIIMLVMLSIIVVQSMIINKDVKENNYLASGNLNSELLAEYIKKGITIGGVTGTLESLDTSDATATAADILSGKTAYVNGGKVTGTLSSYKYATGSCTTRDARDYGDTWCTVSGLTFKPFMVIIAGIQEDYEEEAWACVIDTSLTGFNNYGSSSYDYNQLDAKFSNGGFTITSAGGTTIWKFIDAKYFAVGV